MMPLSHSNAVNERCFSGVADTRDAAFYRHPSPWTQLLGHVPTLAQLFALNKTQTTQQLINNIIPYITRVIYFKHDCMICDTLDQRQKLAKFGRLFDL